MHNKKWIHKLWVDVISLRKVLQNKCYWNQFEQYSISSLIHRKSYVIIKHICALIQIYNKVTPVESHLPVFSRAFNLSKYQRKVKVKATGLVHKYIIMIVNCWNIWSMSFNVHKVTPIHGTMWEKSKFCDLAKFQEKVKVKTTGLVHNFIIPANCWNHDWWSKSNGSMKYGVQKVNVHGTMCE